MAGCGRARSTVARFTLWAAMASALVTTLAVVAPGFVGLALGQAGPTLTLTATPDPTTFGGTITLTATLSGVTPLRGHSIFFSEEEVVGCRCGRSSVSEFAFTNAQGVATVTVPATSPPLQSPAVGIHHFVAAELRATLLEARTDLTVVCPAGQTADATGNACVALYPLAVSLPRPAAITPSMASSPAPSRSGFSPILAGVIGVAALAQLRLARLLRRRRPGAAGDS